jgi:hypothetical protein
MLIYIIPVFKGLEILVFILLIIYFINQSFKVLILYHRNFKFNIWVELTGVLILVLYLYLIFERLDLKSLLFIIIIVQGFKLICYSIFYFQGFNNIKLQIDLKNLQQCFPFFIPLVFGTIRAKIDAYYGTYFFSVNDLSKYQIMLSFLTMAQMGGAFVINPFLKNFYRINNTVVKRLQKKFFIYGWFYAIIMSVLMYFIISKIYNLHFLKEQYLMAFAFIPPLFLHILLINEYYKKNRQNEIAKIASVVVVIQIILGYVLIKNWYISGALFLKLIGQWSIVIILWLWIKDYKKE